MKKQILFVLALCFGLLASHAAAQPALQKRTITKTDKFDFGAGGTLAMTGAPAGSIKIVGTNVNEIEITAVIEVEAANEADLSRLAELTGFITEEGRSRTGITTVGTFNKFGLKKMPKNFPKNLIGLPFRVDYIINVPHYCDLEIDGGKGDLNVAGVEGSMRISFLESRANVEVIGGNTIVTIASGTLDIAMGVRGWRSRSADISVANGTLTARLPSNTSADIDAIVLRTGVIENTFPNLKPRDRKVPFTERSIIAKSGVGGPPVKFSVGDGTLKLMTLTQSH